eukprot:scaffold1440_cov114-Isochrysis_galbana.AAC.3
MRRRLRPLDPHPVRPLSPSPQCSGARRGAVFCTGCTSHIRVRAYRRSVTCRHINALRVTAKCAFDKHPGSRFYF